MPFSLTLKLAATQCFKKILLFATRLGHYKEKAALTNSEYCFEVLLTYRVRCLSFCKALFVFEQSVATGLSAVLVM